MRFRGHRILLSLKHCLESYLITFTSPFLLGLQFVRKPFRKPGFGRVTDDHPGRLVPGGAGLQSGSELRHQGIVNDHAGFQVQRPDLENPFPAVGSGIYATDQRIVKPVSAL
jgi:hypothetical protein